MNDNIFSTMEEIQVSLFLKGFFVSFPLMVILYHLY